MIILPDIHGRTFWKECVKGHENETIIFLGDYLDPYSPKASVDPFAEEITKKSAIDNFLEIIEFKKAHMDNVILLLGNHDCMKYIFPMMPACRTDFQNLALIQKIFEDNHDLFKFGHYTTINNMTFTFTHAPILKEWQSRNLLFKDCNDARDVIDLVNKLLINVWADDDIFSEEDFGHLSAVLNQVSIERGGYWGDTASLIWADINDINDKDFEFENTFQIFGHTQMLTAIVSDFWANLDTAVGFKLNEDTGVITRLDGSYNKITKI